MAEFSDPADAFDALIDGIDEVDNADMLEVGHAAVALVVARTKHGSDVNGQAFKRYTAAYEMERVKAGYSATPDLVRSGHMIGGMAPVVTGPNEVTIGFPSEIEAIKASVNNDGCKKTVGIAGHVVDKHTRKIKKYSVADLETRVSKARSRYQRSGKDNHLESLIKARTDLSNHLAGKVKYKHRKVRKHQREGHDRRMNTPAREFLDVRQSREIDFLAEVAGEAVARRVRNKIR